MFNTFPFEKLCSASNLHDKFMMHVEKENCIPLIFVASSCLLPFKLQTVVHFYVRAEHSPGENSVLTPVTAGHSSLSSHTGRFDGAEGESSGILVTEMPLMTSSIWLPRPGRKGKLQIKPA